MVGKLFNSFMYPQNMVIKHEHDLYMLFCCLYDRMHRVMYGLSAVPGLVRRMAVLLASGGERLTVSLLEMS